jgi:S-(hydroxymethyl)glutathione dehydrogenase/alcohol dehydrogenase
MKTEAAVLWELGGDWTIETVELDPPRPGEVLVRYVASGMCHSDDHLVTGDIPMPLPVIGGHEGGGIVEAVGSAVTSLVPGDHVVTSFLPSCGWCTMCVTGHPNLCEQGAATQGEGQDPPHHIRGAAVPSFCQLGTFARHSVVPERSLVKIDPELPLDRACLVGCGVSTGWGSAVNAAGVRAGDDVAVIGTGGLGIAAIQGARLAGARRIFAIDPVEFKREEAKRFGATHVAESITAALPLINDVTWGRLCKSVICTMSLAKGSMMNDIVALSGKKGRVVLTNWFNPMDNDMTLNALSLIMYEREIVGSLVGGTQPHNDVPRLLALYREGQLDLDSMVTRTYPLEDINDGYRDLKEGRNIRGVLLMD